MNRSFLTIFAIMLMAVAVTICGCKGKVEKAAEAPVTEPTETAVTTEEVVVNQAPVTESATHAKTAVETIPPTASVPTPAAAMKEQPADKTARNKEIQTALKNANFYDGNIDGKMGPKTKRAIVEFQKAKGLKADGRVGSKTWAELEKYLTTR